MPTHNFVSIRKRCVTPRPCHCEEGALARDAAIHRVSRDTFGECGSLTSSQWIATGYALAMTRVSEKARDDNTLLSLRGGNEVSDAAIHRVSKNASGECGSLTEDQWIATPFRLAMTGGAFSS